ncbi:MAG: Asp-tRNA(Asn)/Glu-tRNA(Gln) amidotransferase subunit GatB [Candidatus Daviesbacteria bacterium]|nr:Asp-tRNA(Asn)/Glu-tRNA(Gln) amidotransferase subunit GatB [Candidatus Daviesbacteria bacterium]
MKQLYEPIIGLEVHVELNTKSKMFCKCSADYFGKEPNTHTCPVCLGLPGALPYINETAIESCMKIGLALGCTVSEISRFERKNYFYPDLAKGYQISQYRWPLCKGGRLQITGNSGQDITIRINRVHQEEDTGKLTHVGNETLIDFNRCGVPLVEIVTEPDFHGSEKVRDFAKKLQQLFRYLGVSNADMERGDMRLEANVSVRKIDMSLREDEDDEAISNMDGIATPFGLAMTKNVRNDKPLPNYRIELKNINSFRFMVAAIEYEIKRQSEALEKGEKLTAETRGWDQVKKETYLQRSKEEANDYRYFPEPDLPELRIKNKELRIKEEMPELPWNKEERFVSEYGLTKDNARILAESNDLAEYYESVVKLGKQKEMEPKQIANYLINQKPDINKVSPEEIIKNIQSKSAGIIGDEAELKKIAFDVIKENSESAEAFKAGKLGALNVLLGAIMKKTAGKADIEKAKEILENLLSK